MRRFLGIALAIFVVGEANAFSKREIADAAYHWGRVDFAAQECDRMTANARIRATASATLEKNGGEAWKSGYELGRTEAAEYFEGTGAEAFCKLSWVFYGRDGQTVKNLLVRN